MNASRGGLLLLILTAVTASSESESFAASEPEQVQDLPRYVVFPGLDADDEEIAEVRLTEIQAKWNIGFASPFNVFFGPKPYVLGWVGEAPFGPVGEEGEEGWEGEEEEEGELEGEEVEGEEVEGEEEEEEVDPDYDYEKA